MVKGRKRGVVKMRGYVRMCGECGERGHGEQVW